MVNSGTEWMMSVPLQPYYDLQMERQLTAWKEVKRQQLNGISLRIGVRWHNL